MRKMILKIFLATVLLITAGSLPAQQLYLPAAAYTNITEMDKYIPALAVQVMHVYEKKHPADKAFYFGSKFRYQIIAGDYQQALNSIDSISEEVKKTDTVGARSTAFPFKVYAMAKLNQRQDTGFYNFFDAAFSTAYGGLSFRAADAAENYFKADLNARQGRYIMQTARLRQLNSDSISYGEAQALCFNYLNYIVYGAESPRVNMLMDAVNRKQYFIDDGVMITMRDGAQISATIVRQRNVTTPQPVILKFGIYASQSEVPETKYIAAHGYVGIIADTRGKRLSPQPIEPFVHDANDAYDIIDWINKQPWCNGKIGMYGGSYLGFTQWAAVKKLHPALKTIVPQAAVGIGVDFPTMAGIFSGPEMLSWFHLVMDNKLTNWNGRGSQSHWDSVPRTWYTTGRAFNTLDTIEGHPSATFKRFLQHPSLDDFWGSMVPYKNEFANINIPVLTVTGYYDDDQRGAMYYFDQHHLYNKNAEHYLLIGPYDHGGSQGYPGDPPPYMYGYSLDTAARIKIIDVVFEWFDHILKGGVQPALLKDKINFEVMGANQWRHVPSLRQMNNDSITFYFSNQQDGDNYRLLARPAPNGTPIHQQVDLADRSDSTVESYALNGEGEDIIDTTTAAGNYIRFSSNPLATPCDINGSFIANLDAVINKKDMDISIRLYEQQPDGKFFELSSNIARCSYIKDAGKRQLFQPGKKENIYFTNAFFTSRRLQTGSRIVVLIGVNKSPAWEINYGTGKNVSEETIKDAGKPLQIQWLTTNSYIRLPVWK